MSAFYEMSEMTSSEFRDAASTIEIALVPVGATEQHGPYLALATDYVVAHRLAQAIARMPLPFHLQTRNGAFGDARLATVEIGRDIVETAIERTLEFIDGFING
jgi:creatinine amidohydrolase/Fe(II)-dependent formamide hydrolase-like protein